MHFLIFALVAGVIAAINALWKLDFLPLRIAEKRNSIFVPEIRLMSLYWDKTPGLWFFALELAKSSPTEMDAYEMQWRARHLRASQLEFYTYASRSLT